MNKTSKKSSTKIRRKKALIRLEKQLVFGTKKPKGTCLILDEIPLSVEDINRIKAEIQTLKSRI